MKPSIAFIVSVLMLGEATCAFADESAKKVYPKNVDQILYQRDLHGATQAYLWGQSLGSSLAWMESNLRVADYMDYVTYTTPFEKRFIITANMSTPYMVASVDLSKTGGLVTFKVPAGPTGGIVNDLQMRNITDTGLAGPDKGKGGVYLIVGPGAKAPENHDAAYVVHSKTNKLWIGTRLLSKDPAENERMKQESTISAYGSPSKTKIVPIGNAEYRGWARFGIDYWKDLHAMIQDEPMGPEDAMALQFLKRLGIEKGKPFAPSKRQEKLMLEAERLGYTQSVATSAGRISDPQLAGSRYYPNRNWSKILNLSSIETHIDPDTKSMDLDARTSYAHEAISMSIGMTADTVGVGSKYLAAYKDADQNWLNGDHVYQLRLPKDVPAEDFWSIIAYRAKTRTFVINKDMKPGITSRQDVVYDKDGSVTITYANDCTKYKNCIQTNKGEDFFTYFRAYAPKAAFFDKSWQLSDIVKMK